MSSEPFGDLGRHPEHQSRPMTCLIVVPSLRRAGAETQAVDLANGLSAKGHKVHLCTVEALIDLRSRLSADVRFHCLERKGKYDLSLIGKLAAVIDGEKVDVLLGVLQFAMLIAWAAAWKSSTRPPVVAAIHTTVNRDLRHAMFDRLLYRKILRRLPAIIFVCEHQRAYWMRRYPELQPQSAVVYNGVAPIRFHREEFVELGRRLRLELAIPEQAFVFACVAAFRPEKGHGLLLEALRNIEGNVCVVFAGDGELRPEIESRVAASGLRERTRFLGSIPDTRPLITSSNATVLASTAVETFSMAMLESMALGVPMVAPSIGGLPEAITDHGTGLLFPVSDTSALARCMQFLVDDPEEAVRMGVAARMKVEREFTLDRMVSGTERILSEVLTRTNRIGRGDAEQ